MADPTPLVRRSKRMALLLTGSLVLQTVQLGVFPLAAAQILSRQGFDAGLIGGFLAVMWAAVLVAGPFVPRLMRAMSSRLVNGLGCGLSLGATGGLLASHAPAMVLLSSVLMGIGLIVRWILCDTLVVYFSPEAHRGRFIGLHEALMGLGIGCGPLLFAVLDVGTVLVVATCLCALGAACFLGMDATDSVRKASPETGTQTERTPARIGLLQLTTCAPVLLVALAAALFGGFIESSSIALLPLSFEAGGLSLPTAAILVSAFGFGGTVLQPPLGWAADRFGYARMQGLCAVTMVLTCLAAMANMDVSAYLATFFLMGAAAGGFNTLAVIHAGKILTDDHVPLAMTSIAMLYTVGSIVGPIAAGVSLEYAPINGIYWVFLVGSLLLIGLFASRAHQHSHRN